MNFATRSCILFGCLATAGLANAEKIELSCTVQCHRPEYRPMPYTSEVPIRSLEVIWGLDSGNKLFNNLRTADEDMGTLRRWQEKGCVSRWVSRRGPKPMDQEDGKQRWTPEERKHVEGEKACSPLVLNDDLFERAATAMCRKKSQGSFAYGADCTWSFPDDEQPPTQEPAAPEKPSRGLPATHS